jgi:hypothetical protein
MKIYFIYCTTLTAFQRNRIDDRQSQLKHGQDSDIYLNERLSVKLIMDRVLVMRNLLFCGLIPILNNRKIVLNVFDPVSNISTSVMLRPVCM